MFDCLCSIINSFMQADFNYTYNWLLKTELFIATATIGFFTSKPRKIRTTRNTGSKRLRLIICCEWLKGTHREKALSNKSPALKKSMNLNTWVVLTSNQLFINSYTKTKSPPTKKKNVVTGKTLFFVLSPFFTLHSICLNIGFWSDTFVWKCCVSNLKTFN